MELKDAIEEVKRQLGAEADTPEQQKLAQATFVIAEHGFGLLERAVIALEAIAQPININVENCGGISAATVSRT